MKRMTVPILLTTIAFAGCGGGDDGPSTAESDEDQIRAVAKDVYAAYDAKDWGKACDLFSPKAKGQLAQAAAFIGAKPGDCPDTLAKAAAMEPNSKATLSITTVKITGDTAIAPGGSTEDGEREDLSFEKFEGRWYAGVDPE